MASPLEGVEYSERNEQVQADPDCLYCQIELKHLDLFANSATSRLLQVSPHGDRLVAALEVGFDGWVMAECVGFDHSVNNVIIMSHHRNLGVV